MGTNSLDFLPRMKKLPPEGEGQSRRRGGPHADPALLGWSQRDLAERSGVSEPTIKRLEAADGDLGGRQSTVDTIRAALEGAGVEFTNGERPGVRFGGETYFAAYIALTRGAMPTAQSENAQETSLFLWP